MICRNNNCHTSDQKKKYRKIIFTSARGQFILLLVSKFILKNLLAMIHKRFNPTRRLIWATFLLTVFIHPAIKYRHTVNNVDARVVENSNLQKPAADVRAVNNIVAVQ